MFTKIQNWLMLHLHKIMTLLFYSRGIIKGLTGNGSVVVIKEGFKVGNGSVVVIEEEFKIGNGSVVVIKEGF